MTDQEIILFNSSQEKVIDIFSSEKTVRLQVETLPEGVYYLNVKSKV